MTPVILICLFRISAYNVSSASIEKVEGPSFQEMLRSAPNIKLTLEVEFTDLSGKVHRSVESSLQMKTPILEEDYYDSSNISILISLDDLYKDTQTSRTRFPNCAKITSTCLEGSYTVLEKRKCEKTGKLIDVPRTYPLPQLTLTEARYTQDLYLIATASGQQVSDELKVEAYAEAGDSSTRDWKTYRGPEIDVSPVGKIIPVTRVSLTRKDGIRIILKNAKTYRFVDPAKNWITYADEEIEGPYAAIPLKLESEAR